MDGSNIQHYFEKLDRSLKRLGIVLVDDFEEVKKGVPAPIVALVRKLLFNTSTIVMKYMLLRGCPSHVSDKKVVISLFDLLRETVKYSPPISIDQFFNTGFGQHKVVILTKLAEYVAHIDRMAGRSGNKTAFVVHNEVLQSLATQDDDAAAAVAAEPAPTVGSDLAVPVVSSPSISHGTPKRPSSATRSPLASSTGASAAPTTFGQRRSLSSQRAAMRSSSTAAAVGSPLQTSATARSGNAVSPIADHFNAALAIGDVDAPPQPPAAQESRPSADGDRPAVPPVDLSQCVLKSDVQALVEAAVQSQLQQTVREISEKYDFVINKLVAAVDAEFTLLNNRLKQLETALAVAPGGDGQAAAGDAPPAAAAEATAIDAGAR